MKISKTITLCLFVTLLLGACQTTLMPATPASTNVGPTAEIPAGVTETQFLPTSTPTIVAGADRGWWNDAVFYEIFVRSFKDSNGDGIGDFQGVISELDYLNDGDPNTTTDLGINAIWLMPIFPSPSYHGYDVTDYRAVNPDYGTLDDFKQLLSECHKRGIHVIIDFVINHTSNQHPWFKEAQSPASPYHDYYVWSEPAPKNNNGPWGQNAWYKAPNGQYYYAPFWSGMPDLNYHNPAVTTEIYDITRFWLQDVGVDGFRVDAARYLFEEGVAQQDTKTTIAWFQDWYMYLKSLNPEAFSIGEVWADLQITAKYQQPTKGLESMFMFDLAGDTLGSVFAPNPSRLIKAYQDTLSYYPNADFGVFLTNHDQQRVASYFSDKVSKEKQAAFIYLTGPGIPFIYYGEEIGMTGNKPDEKLRTPMQWSNDPNAGFTTVTPWEPVNKDWAEKTVEKLSAEPDSLLSWYRELVHLREQTPALRSGSYIALISSCRSVYATLRVPEGSAPVLTLLNIGVINQENCTVSLEGSPIPAGTYTVENLWGVSKLSEVTFGAGGSLQQLPLSPLLEGGESFIVQLKNP